MPVSILYKSIAGHYWFISSYIPVSILHKSTAGHYQPVRVADGLITTCYRFIKNASWDNVCFVIICSSSLLLLAPHCALWLLHFLGIFIYIFSLLTFAYVEVKCSLILCIGKDIFGLTVYNGAIVYRCQNFLKAVVHVVIINQCNQTMC